jgi:transposase-like protein
MAKQGYRISTEIKEEIIKKIKHEGLSVIDAAKQYGISDKTIYNWLGTKACGTVSLLEHNKVKKENEQLKQIIGDLTIKMSMDAKKGLSKVW